ARWRSQCAPKLWRRYHGNTLARFSMYCPNCGKKGTLDQKYCRSCGMQLGWVSRSLAQFQTHDSQTAHKRTRLLKQMGKTIALGILMVVGGIAIWIMHRGIPGLIGIAVVVMAVITIVYAIVSVGLKVEQVGKLSVKTSELADSSVGSPASLLEDREPIAVP